MGRAAPHALEEGMNWTDVDVEIVRFITTPRRSWEVMEERLTSIKLMIESATRREIPFRPRLERRIKPRVMKLARKIRYTLPVISHLTSEIQCRHLFFQIVWSLRERGNEQMEIGIE